MPNRNNVVLLEFKDDAEAFLYHCKKNDINVASFRIIALQPHVQVFLRKLGIKYENTFGYLPNSSHAKILMQCEAWVRFLDDHLLLGDGSGVKRTYTNTFIFYVRFYMFYFLELMEILENIHKTHKVNKFCVVEHKNSFISAVLPLIQDNERFLVMIAGKFAGMRGIEFCKIEPVPKLIVEPKKKQLNTILLRQMLSNFFKVLWSARIGHKPVILLTTTGYNMGRLVQQLKKVFPNVSFVEICSKDLLWCTSLFFTENISHLANMHGIGRPLDARIPLEEQPLNASNSKSWGVLAAGIDSVMEKMSGEWRSSFDYNGANFVDVFFEKMERHIRLLLLRLHNESKTMQQIVDQLNVKLLISPFARERSLMIAELCRNKRIPALMVSHGTIIKPNNELERIEYFHMGQSLSLSEFYNYAAIQSPVQEAHFISYQTKNIPILTGNLILAKTDKNRRGELRNQLVGDLNANKKILLYPENTRERNSMRFHVFQTFDEFLVACTDLINAVNKLDNVHLVIRLHAGSKNRLTPEEFRVLLPHSDRVTVTDTKMAFSEVLSAVDLVINFSSTAIEDALQNSIPVLLYDNTKRYKHLENAQTLGKGIRPHLNGAYYISDSEYLEKGLKWILDNHISNNDRVPKSLFNQYVFSVQNYENLINFISKTIRSM